MAVTTLSRGRSSGISGGVSNWSGSHTMHTFVNAMLRAHTRRSHSASNRQHVKTKTPLTPSTPAAAQQPCPSVSGREESARRYKGKPRQAMASGWG